jgi:glyoxylase-like metal-dependent hydrolase (beta-lactamase superfamily II)
MRPKKLSDYSEEREPLKIINIGNLIMNQYLLQTTDGYIAIDTGYAGGFERYRSALQKNGIDLRSIRYLFLTHVHDDHAGFLNELLSASGATLIVDKEAPERLLVGHNIWDGSYSGRLAKGFSYALSLFGKGKHLFPPFQIPSDAIVWDRLSQPLREVGVSADILYLPGHTADSIGILTDDRQLFCGDAAMNGIPSIHRNIIWIENMNDYKHSWDVMIASKADRILPSHGHAFPAMDLRKYHAGLDSIRLC